jgi:2-polyprenyl-3-methyl-5-hydroxy-6-metoxy-1,4-benzoquinol methylase
MPRALERVRRTFARIFAARAIRGLGAGGQVLDIGCGDGTLLAALAARGFTCIGTELPGRYPRRPAIPGVTVVETADVADLHLADGSCRLVVLRHALEHLRDPAATLREARRLLAQSGRLVIAVPNLASWQSRRAGARWVHLDIPRHLVHFTPATLQALVRGAGFRIERTAQLSFEHGPYGWLRTFLGADDRVVIAAVIALLPVCVVLTMLEALARRGAVVEIWARPSER